MAREPHWTESIAVGSRKFVESVGQAISAESIAVGSRKFVESVGQAISDRQALEYSPIGENAWVLREEVPAGPAIA